MSVFHQFDLTSRRGPANVRNVQHVGKGAIFLIAVIAWSWPRGPTPMVWLLLGLSCGLYLILQGSRDLVFTTGLRSRLGDKLAAASSGWFPPLAFMSQQLYVALATLAIWLTIEELGFQAGPKEHAGVLCLVVLSICKRFVGRLQDHQPSRVKQIVNELLIAALVIVLTFAGVGLIYTFYPPTYSSQLNYTILMTWMVACLIIIAQLVITTSRILQRTPTPMNEP